MRHLRPVAAAAACVLALTSTAAGEPSVPFQLAQTDAAPAPGSAAFLTTAPAVARVSVDGDRLVADGRRVRFWGVNLCGEAAFPPKDQADAIAGRLRKLGINSVRLHHLDQNWQTKNLFGPMPNETTRELDPEMLDRLDYFVAALKRAGVYSNLNILCSRKHVAGDGVPQDVLDTPWKLSHTLAFVDDELRELHKETARQLVTHVNPYTGLAWGQDPAVAIVEVTNENGLIQPFMEGQFAQMPERHRGMLREKWNDWLGARYDGADAVAAAWASRTEPLGGSLIGEDGGAFRPVAQQGAEAELDADGGTLTYEVTTPGGAGWTGEVVADGITLEKGKLYTIEFTAGSADYAGMKVDVSLNRAPWTKLGVERWVELTPEPRAHAISFIAAQDVEDARYLFSGFGGQRGRVTLSGLALRPGGTVELPADLDLTPGSLPLVGEGALATPVPAASADFMRFLADAEQDYWSDMVAFLRENCGVESIIVPTIVGYTAPHVMKPYDVIDTHEYWAIPVGEPWTENWSVNPDSLLSTTDAKAVTNPAVKRVVGKPFFVSEYNHCNPNVHAAEGPLMLASYAALQDWDGAWYFAYHGDTDDWSRDFIDSPFDIAQHPATVLNHLVGALIFRRGDVSPAASWVTRPMSEDTQAELLASVGTPWNNVNLSNLGVSGETALRYRVGLILDDPATPAPQPAGEVVEVGRTPVASDTGELTWQAGPDGRFVADTPRTLALVGTGGAEFGAAAWQPEADDWHTFALASLTDAPLAETPAALLVVTGAVRNTNMGLQPEVATVGLDWGEAPTLIDPVRGTLTLPVGERVLTVHALDEAGQKTVNLPVATEDGVARFETAGDTLWYLLEWQ